MYEQEENASLRQDLERARAKIAELQEEKKENELKIKEMEREIEELKIKPINVTDYKNWKYTEIIMWIVSLTDHDGNKVFTKYKDILSDKLKANDLLGTDLYTVQKTDLTEFGINIYRDRNLLFQEIQKLTHKVSNMESNEGR